MKSGIFILCSLLVWCASSASLGQDTSAWSEALGSVKTASDPQVQDRNDAIAAALRKILTAAVEKSELGDSSQRVCKASIEKLNLEALNAFFTGKQILNDQSRTGYYEVRVRANLNDEKLGLWSAKFKDIDAIIKKLRVMIVIPEHHLQGPIPDPAGETEMVNLFVKEGFRVVDDKQVKTIRDKDLVKRALKDDQKELLAIAQGWGADMMIVGEAFSQDVLRDPNTMGNMFPARARIEARLFVIDTGEIISAGDGEGGALDVSPAVAAKAAIRTAATKLANKMIVDIVVNQQGGQALGNMRVSLAGVDFEQKLQFMNVLDEMKEMVTGVEEISYMESRAEMDVATTASAAKFAEEVFLRAKKKGLNIKVAEQSKRKCVFEVVSSAATQKAG